MTRKDAKDVLSYYFLDILTEEERSIVWNVLTFMNPTYRKILYMRFNGDIKYTWEEVGRNLRTPEATIRHWYDRALTIFAENLEDEIGYGRSHLFSPLLR